jgi:NAD(P)H-hydrate epimerase
MDVASMASLYTASQTRELDRIAIEEAGIPGIRLMQRAAEAAFDALLEKWPQPGHIQVLCGTGNNGGDGYLLADMARLRGIPVSILQLGDAAKITGDALLAREQALADGVAVAAFRPAALSLEGVIVDAMLGTGLGGDVGGAYREAVLAVNGSGLPVLAIDIPSGLCADTGRVLGCAVKADLTVTFIARKRGLYTLDAPDCAGEVRFASLAVPDKVYRRVMPDCFAADLELLLAALPQRPSSAHKGLYGTVLVIGGDYGMAGAASLAAEAALRSGAGLVRVATRPEHVAPIIARRPEIMAVGVESGQALEKWVATADVLVTGPGLGSSAWSEQVLQVAARADKPMVLDADGLNLLATGRLVAQARRDNWLLTPHPGEAGRLLGVGNAEVQADRFAAVRALQRRYGGVVLLKGNGTLVADDSRLLLSRFGNPGMASGGMGDVLSGVIGALLAQHLAPLEAATLGACLHGAAADIAAQQGQRGLVATDLMAPLRQLLG